jgi:hypothetical protein
MTDVVAGAIWEALHNARAPSFNRNFNSFCNEMISRGYMSAVSTCSDSAALSQQIYSSCTGDPSGSAGCLACINARSALRQGRATLNDDFFTKTGEIATELSPTLDCRVACKSCVADEILQDGVLKVTTNCVNNTDFVTKFKAAIASEVTQDVSSKMDVFGGILSSLTSNQMEIQNSVTNAINETITQEFITKLLARCVAVQNMSLKGSSMMVSRTTQSLNVATVSTLVTQSRSTVISFGQVMVAAAQKLLEENKTVDSMLKLVSAPLLGVVDMITSTMFMLMVIAITIMAIIVVGGAIYFIRTSKSKTDPST